MKNLFLSQLRPVLKLCYKNKAVFLASVMLDIILFFVLLFANYFTLTAMQEHITKFADLVQAGMLELAASNTTQGISPAMFKTPEIMAVYHQVLKYLLMLVIIALVSWIVFKGINWYLANRLIRKVNLKEFARKFISHTLLAFVCFAIINLLMLRMIAYSTFEFLPLIGASGSRLLAFVLVLVLAYFVFISYSLIPNTTCKKLARFAVKNYKQILPAHLLVSFALIILAYITVYIIRFNYYAPFIFALLVFFPAMTYGRIYIVVVINKVLKRG